MLKALTIRAIPEQVSIREMGLWQLGTKLPCPVQGVPCLDVQFPVSRRVGEEFLFLSPGECRVDFWVILVKGQGLFQQRNGHVHILSGPFP